MNPRRILHCVGSLEVGGEQRYLAQIANRIDPARFEQIVAYTGPHDGGVRFSPHIRCVNICPQRPSAARIRDWPVLRSYLGLVAREDPDILTTHGPGLWHLVASAAARSRGKRVVHTIQRPFGNRARSEDVIIKAPPLRLLAYAATDRFVALGTYYADDQIRRWHIPERKIVLNYIGLDLEEHRPDERLRADARRELGLSDATPVIGIVARLHPMKGVDRGLRAFAALHARRPAARMIIVGNGQSRGDLERLAAELGVSSSVTFLGERTDTPRLFNAMDAFLQTTHNPLNGISSIEAMASGLPILTAVSEVEEERMAADTCVHGESGLFLRLGDLEASAGELARLIDDRPRLLAMGRRSRELAEQRFDITRHVARLEQLYEDLASGAVV